MGVNALEVRRRVMLAQPHEAVASGAVASFRTDILSPLKMSFDLLPIQTGEGDPSPENVRPISGHDGFIKTGTGKNLLAKGIDRFSDVPNTLAECFFIKAGTYRLSVESISNATSWRYGIRMKDKNGNNLNSLDYRPNQYMSWNTINNLWLDCSNGTSKERTINIAVDCYIRIVFALGDTSESTVFNNPQIEIGSVTTDYESPNIHSYSTTFPTPPGTVYGGHVTDNGDGTYDLSVNYYMVKAVSPSTFGARSATISAPVTASGYTLATNPFYCNRFKPSNYSGADDNHVHFANASLITFRLSEEVGTTRGEWETWFENNPTYVCYKIATPVQYTGLSLTALQSLIGQNHVWVDNADSVSVEYWGH